jgi:hypothetical protein
MPDGNVLHPSYFVSALPDPETQIRLLAIEEKLRVKPTDLQVDVPSDDHGSSDHP